MEWGNISVETVLASGIMSAIVSSIFGVWQKKIEYKNSYYKILLNKRIKIYEKIQRIVGKFLAIDEITSNSWRKEQMGNFYYRSISTLKDIETIMDDILECAKEEMLISPELGRKQHELFELIQKCRNKNPDILIANIACEHKNIGKKVAENFNVLNSDLLELYDIPKFLCESKHNNWLHKKISHIPIVRNWID